MRNPCDTCRERDMCHMDIIDTCDRKKAYKQYKKKCKEISKKTIEIMKRAKEKYCGDQNEE